MSRFKVLSLVAIGLFLGVHPVLASTVAVGTCKPSLVSYTTISAAVVGAPSGSTVEVCPGSYPEQVTITQPLTLKGISSGNAGQVLITVPPSGLTTVTTSFGSQIAPMVDVTSALVNISDVTMDATGYSLGGLIRIVGILYESGSSGVVNEVTVRNLSNLGNTAGIWAENSTATNTSLTIENSSFHDIDGRAVFAQGTALLATVKGNTMQADQFQVQFFSGGSVTGNTIIGGQAGIVINSSAVSVTLSANTVANSTLYGIVVSGGVTVTSNKISNVPVGIYDQEGGSNVYKTNAITRVGTGINLNCNTLSTTTGNTINEATTGLDQVPSSFSGVNSFYNVATLRNGC